MDNFEFYSPTRFIFGKGRETEIGKFASRFGANRILMVYGGASAERSGLLNKVRAALKEAELPLFELGGVKPNPRSGLVYKGIDICRENGVDFVLAVGGGSVIDTAKAIAGGVPYDGDFWDFHIGKATMQSALPVGVILTIAAAGSEGSDGCVITNENGMHKRPGGSELLRPRFAILDPELTETLPPYQTACGVTDIMAHVLERYFTNTPDVETSDRLCEALLLTLVNEAPKVMRNPKDYQARANIMWTGSLAHSDIVGVGRAQDWSSHEIEHELSALYDCAHGAGLAVIFPAWMHFVLEHDVDRFYKLAVRVWSCEPSEDRLSVAKEGVKRFTAFLRSLGMPTSFGELGAKEEDIPTLVENLFYERSGKVGQFVPLGRGECESIYRIAAKA